MITSKLIIIKITPLIITGNDDINFPNSFIRKPIKSKYTTNGKLNSNGIAINLV